MSSKVRERSSCPCVAACPYELSDRINLISEKLVKLNLHEPTETPQTRFVQIQFAFCVDAYPSANSKNMGAQTTDKLNFHEPCLSPQTRFVKIQFVVCVAACATTNSRTYVKNRATPSRTLPLRVVLCHTHHRAPGLKFSAVPVKVAKLKDAEVRGRPRDSRTAGIADRKFRGLARVRWWRILSRGAQD